MNNLHFLASANTGCGFADNFDSILEPNKPGFTYILKGGPGTGKSTLLKTIGKYFEDKKEEVEYFHCSSDFSSLDGVRIVGKNTSVIDGTAPHSKDPIIPNVTEKIVDLGEFIGSDVKKHSSEIKKLLALKQKEYKLVYTYLATAQKLIDLNNEIYKSQFDLSKYAKLLKQTLSKFNFTMQKGVGYNRKLYVEYVGNNKIETTLNINKVKTETLTYDQFTNEQLLKDILSILKDKNYKTISYFDTITNKINGIYIVDLNYQILASNTVSEDDKTIAFNYKTAAALIKKASISLSNARKYHKEVEKFYISSMDFEGISKRTTKLIKQIESNEALDIKTK